jgi:putative membrane-bound dehydrogenase-like protein
MMNFLSRLGIASLAFTGMSAAEVSLTVHDDRLQVALMAEAPSIRNPIGIAVDQEDRVYIIESHTSHRPSNYDGPESDRLQMILDRDDDGVPDSITTAAEGFRQAMNLAVSPQGILYVVCASEIIALHDHNADGIFDGRQTILTLQSDYQHPHYRLTGITFDKDGWLYFSRGNMGGHAYTLRGSDGSTISGQGDGGSILRCQPGGTRLEEVATGFWNVMGMAHLSDKWFFAADNDPESRGPNRLLHIVSGGDYGYQTLYGKGGHHPFLAWDGELPGTLPMVSATREAPSGLLASRLTALPKDYEKSLLVACWGESLVESHALEPNDLSASATSSVILSGPNEFRPVAMAADSKGTVYITDWASPLYNNHDQGRLWRLTSKAPSKSLTKTPISLDTESDTEKILLQIQSKRQASDGEDLLNLLVHGDPFLTHAAIEALAKPVFWKQVISASKDTTPSIRLGALLALRKAHHPDSKNLIGRFLRDPDQVIRQAALRWAVELQDTRLLPALDESITSPKVSLGLLETYLAAKSALAPPVLAARKSGQVASTFDLPYPASDKSLESIIASKATNDHLRALALIRLGATAKAPMLPLLSEWIRAQAPALQIAAIHGLSELEGAEVQVMKLLESVSTNVSYDPQVRAEAIAVWARQVPLETAWVLDLLDDHKAVVRLEASRALRLVGQLEPNLSQLQERYDNIRDNPNEAAVAEQLEFILYGSHAEDKKFASQRPTTLEGWQKELQSGGDVNGGRRLFHSTGLLCSQCHTPGTYQNTLGPNLGNLGQSVDRARIIQSLIEPSSNASPAYQAWNIKTNQGPTEQGVQLEYHLDGSLRYLSLEGSEVIVPASEAPTTSPLSHSIMPSGLQELMTVREMRELVSYLESLGNNLD